jgi:glycine/sarcosine N-methyltransferase
MSEFYQSIAKHYDDIFPLSDALRKFLSSFSITKDDHILDIGCATGEVVLYLARYAHTVTGIDLDSGLIEIAHSKKEKRDRDNARFLVGDMNDIETIFGPSEFRIIVCLGNTFVHLLSIDVMNDFLRKVVHILDDGSLFIFQILNYKKILTRKTIELPLIDNDKITFERRYDHDMHKPLLAFKTCLTVKSTSETINNSINLYPLQQVELMEMSSRHLFRSIRFLGGFDGRIFSEEDDLLIGVLQK